MPPWTYDPAGPADAPGVFESVADALVAAAAVVALWCAAAAVIWAAGRAGGVW